MLRPQESAGRMASLRSAKSSAIVTSDVRLVTDTGSGGREAVVSRAMTNLRGVPLHPHL